MRLPAHSVTEDAVAPAREPPKRELELDELFLGGYKEGPEGGRARKKALCGVAVEVFGNGSEGVCLAVLDSATVGSLDSFVKATTETGAIVSTAGWRGYDGLAERS